MAVAAAAGSTECLRMLIEARFPIARRTDAPMNIIMISYLRPIFQRAYYTPLREAVRKGQVSDNSHDYSILHVGNPTPTNLYPILSIISGIGSTTTTRRGRPDDVHS